MIFFFWTEQCSVTKIFLFSVISFFSFCFDFFLSSVVFRFFFFLVFSFIFSSYHILFSNNMNLNRIYSDGQYNRTSLRREVRPTHKIDGSCGK
jgi:hypothetical protein